MRPLIIPLLLICLTACDSKRAEDRLLADYLPGESDIIFRINDIEGTRSDIRNNELLSGVDQKSPYAILNDADSWISAIKPTNEVLLACENVGDTTLQYSMVTRLHKDLFVPDSIPGIEIDTIRSGKNTIQRVMQNDKETYLGIRDSVFMLSNSLSRVENMLDSDFESESDFQSVSGMDSESEMGAYFENQPVFLSDSTALNFASWTYAELQVLPDALLSTGIVKAKDSSRQLLNVFKGLAPQATGIPKIIPIDANSAYGFTYNDLELIQQQLKEFDTLKTMTLAWNPILETINEVGQIELITGKAIVLKSIDQGLTLEAILPFLDTGRQFRGVDVYRLSASAPELNGLSPLIVPNQMRWVFQQDEFFILTNNTESYEKIITSYMNGSTVQKSSSYEAVEEKLSEFASLYFIQLKGWIKAPISEYFQLPQGDFPDYPLGVLRFTYDRDFSHVSAMLKESSGSISAPGIVQEKYSVQLDAQLLNEPRFFSNHRTNGKDMVVQDIENKIYLISAGGKVLWKKRLEGHVLGEIQEVDLLRNGKKQLAFVTKNTLHVIDRNGNNVAPFPKKFKDDITQPLALFDYDRNRNYRFVVVQGKDVYMYDSKAQIVEGFKYKGTSSPIVMPPQHIRISGKDYLLFAEENGNLNIRSRVGKERIKVSRTFEFTNIPITREGQNFVVITRNNTKESISTSGSISPRDLDVSQSYWFTIKGKTKATLDDNLLRINGNLVELPFGVYTKPQIIISNRKTYIVITETQENKVYLYTSSGSLVSGFPVYGSSLADLGDANRNGRTNLVVKGADNELILYEIR